LVTAEQLAFLQQHEAVVILDCRMGPDPQAGRRAYHAAHIPGAVYFHLDEDLSSPMGEHGGRHPLPDLAVIAAKLGAAGIGPTTRVVAYDDQGQYASRAWWLLRYLGHESVQVLDGGYAAWVALGLPVTAAVPGPEPRTFEPRPQPDMIASMEEVRDRPASLTVIDARSAARFAGQPDLLDEKYGHIPGAANRPWMESVGPDGRWKSVAELTARFAPLGNPQQQIHHCGSGVTACVNLLAMEHAGLQGARLYVGSWSDWCTYPENLIATGKEQ
jgi:thiosulfate/3-mercaptopyruvate sulfurtransferase